MSISAPKPAVAKKPCKNWDKLEAEVKKAVWVVAWILVVWLIAQYYVDNNVKEILIFGRVLKDMPNKMPESLPGSRSFTLHQMYIV